ncbi:ExbD/TolR family protein [candidate division KSB1 bacterium]
MKFQSERKLLDTFSFSSLTDIVLLLLIFFLLSSTFIVQPGIKVKLPQTESTEEVMDKSITVTITKSGTYYLNEKQVALNELGARLNSLVKESITNIAIIKADETVSWGKIAEVMDLCLKAGLDKLNMATEDIHG